MNRDARGADLDFHASRNVENGELCSMSEQHTMHSDEHASWIVAWFILDAIVALAPPLYWAVDGNRALIAGLPVVLIYFIGVASFITASIVVAYLAEARLAGAG
jgi:hypothetical protein